MHSRGTSVILDIKETLTRSIELLKPPYFIERVEINRSIDYWLGKADSEERIYLGTDKEVAVAKAEELMR